MVSSGSQRVATSAADLAALRSAMVAAGQRMGRRGLVSATEGNLSVRLPGDQLLVTPSGLRKEELAGPDLLVVSLGDGGVLAADHGRRPTSDLAIHRAVHRRRPDALAVAHAHGQAALALTLAGERADPADLPETALLLPRLPFIAFGQPGSVELADRIAAALDEPPDPRPTAVLLERHGAVALGTGAGTRDRTWSAEAAAAALGQAVDRLELVEVLCRATRDALLIRAARR